MNVYRSNTSSCNTLHLEMFLFLSVLFTDFKMINNIIGRIFLSMTNALYRSVDKTSAEKIFDLRETSVNTSQTQAEC